MGKTVSVAFRKIWSAAGNVSTLQWVFGGAGGLLTGALAFFRSQPIWLALFVCFGTIAILLIIWDRASKITSQPLPLRRSSEFSFDILQNVWGGKAPDGRKVVVLGIRGRNMGAPSALHAWSMRVRKDGVEYQGEAIALKGSTTMHSIENKATLQFSTADLIATRASSPVPMGGMVEGYLLALFDSQVLEAVPGLIALVSCSDIFGRKYEYSSPLNVGDSGKTTFFPTIHGGVA